MYELTIVFETKGQRFESVNGELNYKGIESFVDAIVIADEFQSEHPTYKILCVNIYKNTMTKPVSEGVPDDAF